MMNAAAGIFLAARRKAKWTNPYITDGLIAMWDGEWNAGPGKHVAGGGTWVNLAGGVDLGRNTAYESPLTGDKYAEFKAGASSMKVMGLSGDNPVFAAIQALNATVEIVAYGTAPVQDAMILFVSNAAWTQRIFIVASSNNNIATGIYGTMSYLRPGYNNTYSGALSSIDSKTRGRVVQMRYALSNRCMIYLNRTYVTTMDHGTANISDGAGIIRVGNDNLHGLYRIYCVRIYDRQLSESEANANYAVDDARFNLP